MSVFVKNPKIDGAKQESAVITRRKFFQYLAWGAVATTATPIALKLLESTALAQEKPKQVFELKGTTLVAKEIHEEGREAIVGNTSLPEDKLKVLTGKTDASEIESGDLKGSHVIKNITVLFFEFGIMAIKETTMDILIEHAVSQQKLDSGKLKVEENGTVLYAGKARWKISTSGQLRIMPVGA